MVAHQLNMELHHKEANSVANSRPALNMVPQHKASVLQLSQALNTVHQDRVVRAVRAVRAVKADRVDRDSVCLDQRCAYVPLNHCLVQAIAFLRENGNICTPRCTHILSFDWANGRLCIRRW